LKIRKRRKKRKREGSYEILKGYEVRGERKKEGKRLLLSHSLPCLSGKGRRTWFLHPEL